MTKPAAPLEVVVHLNAESAPILDHHLGSKEAKNEESIAEIATKVNSKEEAVSKPPQTGATASNIDEIPTGNAVKQPLEKKKDVLHSRRIKSNNSRIKIIKKIIN